MPAYHSFNEAQTRYGLIDPQLTKRGWNLSDRRSLSLEMVVDGYNANLLDGITNFLKYVLKLEELTHFIKGVQNGLTPILERNYKADQTRFLRTTQKIVMQKWRIEVGDLYEIPFTNFGLNAVEKLFSEDELGEILELTKRIVF